LQKAVALTGAAAFSIMRACLQCLIRLLGSRAGRRRPLFDIAIHARTKRVVWADFL
jgi:hypothetical protein